jgi:nucleoside-diphosphate-sugar epimerase
VPDPAGRSALRVAVTGARGFIGSHLVSALSARGDTPVPIARPFTPETLSAGFRAVDAVVHLAGVVSAVRRRDYFAANVDAAALIARAASAAGTPMVHISSLAAAGPAPPSAPRSEDDEPRPINAYGESKLAGERIVQATPDLHWLVLRPGVVYGPGDRALLPLLRYARLGVLPLVGDERAAYTFIYIDDAIRAILAAIDVVRQDASARTTVFIGHREPVGNRKLLDAVRAVARPSARLVPIPSVLTRLAAAFGDLAGAITRRPATINSRRYVELYSPGFVCRVDRMRDCLGVEAAVGLDDGLRRAARWYREQGWLDARS